MLAGVARSVQQQREIAEHGVDRADREGTGTRPTDLTPIGKQVGRHLGRLRPLAELAHDHPPHGEQQAVEEVPAHGSDDPPCLPGLVLPALRDQRQREQVGNHVRCTVDAADGIGQFVLPALADPQGQKRQQGDAVGVESAAGMEHVGRPAVRRLGIGKSIGQVRDQSAVHLDGALGLPPAVTPDQHVERLDLFGHRIRIGPHAVVVQHDVVAEQSENRQTGQLADLQQFPADPQSVRDLQLCRHHR